MVRVGALVLFLTLGEMLSIHHSLLLLSSYYKTTIMLNYVTWISPFDLYSNPVVGTISKISDTDL